MTLHVAAVTVDLDDTLYPQTSYLAGAWSAVAEAGGGLGLDKGLLQEALLDVSSSGSGRGVIVDRALEIVGAPAEYVEPLVEAFRSFAPDELRCYPGARQGLAAVRALVPVACVTDGEPRIQWAKLRALGLESAFDAVVISDEIGREFRKPHPAPFRRALQVLGTQPGDTVHIGDRPDKDVEGPAAVGMPAIRVRQGEYALAEDPAECAAHLATVSNPRRAFDLVIRMARPIGIRRSASARSARPNRLATSTREARASRGSRDSPSCFRLEKGRQGGWCSA